MSEREVFLAALEIRDPDERAAYLDHVCAGDTTLRARVDSLLRSHESAGSFLEEPAALVAEETVAQRAPGVPNAASARDEPGARPDPSRKATHADSEATRAQLSSPIPNDQTVEYQPPHKPTNPDATIDGLVASKNLPRGETVHYFGDYEILKELGRGGMGVVYKARQLSLNRPVALKMIKAGVLADDAELRRFQIEAEAVALLDHPRIVSAYEVGEHDGQRYLSIKLIDGGNLGSRLNSFKENLRASVALLIETAEAVQHAHMRGILHRDLKPANILIDMQGHPHITDFGLAKLMESDFELTASGAIMGTPAYMSPEQAAGRRGEMSLATDVYGLGAIFYALLTGRAPFGGDSVIETLDAVRTRLPEPPRKRNARVARDLELICLKCLEKSPGDRYPTAGALAEDLRRWSAGEPVSVRPVSAVERVAKWARRNPTLAAAYTLGLLVVMLGGLGSAAVWQWRAAEHSRDGEKIARRAAESAREEEEKARVEAERLSSELENSQEQVAREKYGRTMEVAHQEWRDGNVAATLALLESSRPDLRGWEWSYLHRLCHSDLLRLNVYAAPVNSASFSADGSPIITGTSGTARVWDAQTGSELLTLKGFNGSISSASFNPDGSRIVTSSWDKTAKIWDAQTGAAVLTMKGHTRLVTSASFSPDGSRVVTGSGDNTAKVWDARSGVEVLTLRGQTAEVWSASFSPDGTRIVTGSGDKSAKVWDAISGTEVLTLKGHTGPVRSATFSPDGSRVVTGSHDRTAKVWDARTGAEVLTPKGHSEAVRLVSFSPDGARIVTASKDNMAKVWDARTGAEILTLRGHTRIVTSATFSPDAAHVVTASWDNTAKVWVAWSGAELVTLKGHTDGVTSATFSPDAARVVTASWDNTAKV